MMKKVLKISKEYFKIMLVFLELHNKHLRKRIKNELFNDMCCLCNDVQVLTIELTIEDVKF